MELDTWFVFLIIVRPLLPALTVLILIAVAALYLSHRGQ